MAKNRHSENGCPSTTPFDREIKRRFFPTFSVPHVTNLRGVFQDNEEANTLISDFLTAKITIALESMSEEEMNAVTKTYGQELDIASLEQNISDKLARKEKLTPFEESFMEDYASAINAFIETNIGKDIIKREMEKAGVQAASTSTMYGLFKSKIPSGHRAEVTTQLCAAFIKILDMAEQRPEYKNFTRAEIIDVIHNSTSPLKGFNFLMYQVRRALDHQYQQLKNESAQNEEKIKADPDNPDNKKLYVMTEDVDKLFQTLLNDNDAWAACVYQTKSMLLEAEKIKIGNKVEYVAEVDEDDVDNADPDRDVQSAEDEGAEHWMLKTDTISSFNSMAREVRSLLYKLTTGKRGVLGFPSIIDTMLIHQNLMELRSEKFCQDSSEFLQALSAINTPWAKQLYDILSKDTYKRTSVFNAYRKNHLNYVYHRKSYIFDKVAGMRVPVFFRNKSGRNTRVLLGAYRAGVLDIDPNNKSCLFKADGTVNSDVKAVVKSIFDVRVQPVIDGIPLWNDVEGIYNMQVWGTDKIEDFTEAQLKERQRDFILTVNDILNLHLYESDIDIIMSNSKEFKSFCTSVHEVMQDILTSGARHQTINFLMQQSRVKKHFQKLVRAAKHSITIQERDSPIENSFRYKKSTYMAHTVPNSLGDNLERLGRAASKGIKAFKQYIEDNYLCCPAFATKTDDGYDIYNYWIKLMYESTQEDLDNPTSFVNKFINELTRGLGTDEVEFSAFSEKDNYIFTLNEFLQNKRDSDGKFGATPLFITGDSNSTRFLTTPILSSEEILSKMVDNVLQEFKRMEMFDSMLEFFENPDNIDPSSTEYSKRRKLKVSEGHGGKTVSEWMQEKEAKRPSIIRNRNQFTFFPFLNSYKDELTELYNNSNTPEGKVVFIGRVRELLNAHLGELYTAFLDDLKSRGVVSEIGRTHNTLNPTEIAIQANDGSVINTSGDLGLLWNFYLNNKFNLIQQLQFLTIDPGFYKNTEDLQKRFKENIAAGDLLDLEALDPSDETGQTKIDNNNGKQKVRYIDEILTDLDASDEEGGSKEDRDFMAALRQHPAFKDVVGDEKNPKKGKYNRNTLTDGQGYRSFSSYRKLMIMRGEPHWSKAHEEVYQIIMRNRRAGKDRLDNEDLQRILDLGVVFQPLKPFYYGFEELALSDGTKILVPVQHKYSEYPIIPELLPAGNRLGELGKAMEEDGTDLVCCTTCVKVGGFGSTTVKHCKTKDDFKSAFTDSYEHQLPLQGWRQQSNVPEHVDSSRARGTQFTKHGYGSIAETSGNKHYGFLKRLFKKGEIKLTKNKTISIKDGLNAQNLIQLFSAIGSAGFIHSSNKLNEQISNPREASDILSELRANDSRGAKDNIAAYNIDNEGEMLMSPSEGMMAVDNMASLLSKLRKEVVKQPIKGGSAVQVSAFGFEDVLKVHTKKSPDGKFNIVYADCAVPFAFSFSYEDGTVVDLSSRYLEYVDPNTGMLLDEEGNPVEPEEAVEGELGKEFYGWNTKLGKQFPGILDMIAYRIPTEKDYSILNLKAKRFFPRTAGGTIMVPSQFTTIAGFDFDIDKLYFIRREYKFEKQPSISNYDVWTDLYNETTVGKQIKPYLEQALDNALNNVEGALYLGKDLHDYWGTALDLMAKEGKDIAKFPKTAEEAFSEFVGRNIGRYSRLKSYYDAEKTVLENSQTAVNNLFFDYMQARLEDYDTFSERYTPGGFQMLEDALPVMMAIRYAVMEGKGDKLAALADSSNPLADLMELAEEFKDYSPNYDPTELSTIAHYQTYNALYDNCISISAVQNINQRLTALLNELSLVDPVKFGSLLDSLDPGAGGDIRRRFVNGVDTELLTTNYLAASVDAVKKALLEFFGIDDKNLNIGCLMSKIGCTPVDIGLLLNQPVVTRAMEIMKEGKGFKSLSNSLDEAIQELAGKSYHNLKENFYYTLSNKAEGSNKGIRDAYVTTDNLIKYIGMDASVDYGGRLDDFVKGQFAVVHLMKELQADSQELAEQVAISQSTSVKSVKSSFGSVQAVLQKAMAFALKFGGQDSRYKVGLPSQLRFIIDPTIRFNKFNMEEVLGECLESPYCMEQIAFSAIMGYAEALGDYFPYMSGGFTIASEGLASLTNRGYLSADMFDIHNKAAMMFFLERITDMFNESNHTRLAVSENETIDTNMPNRIFYSTVFPSYFKQLLEINEKAFKEGKTDVLYKDIPILGSISAELENYDKGDTEHKLVLKMESIGGLQARQKDALIDSWEAMFYSDDPILKDLAKHMFMYSYYNRGFDFGPTTFMSLVPLAVKTELGDGEYADFFNRVFNLEMAPNGLLQVAGEATDGIVLKDYYKAFILNTRNLFYQFTKKIYAPKTLDEKSPYNIIKNNMHTVKFNVLTGEVATEDYLQRLKEYLTEERQKEGDSPEAITKYIDNYIETYIKENSAFTVTIDNDSDRPLVDHICTIKTDETTKEVISATFTPCIEIDGAVYICDSNLNSDTNSQFNVIESGTMTYYRMDVPTSTDYSTPTLYGTKARALVNTGNGNMVEILTKLEKSLLPSHDSPASGSDSVDDAGNVHGSSERLPVPIATYGYIINTLADVRRALNAKLYRTENVKDKAGELTRRPIEETAYTEAAIKIINGIIDRLYVESESEISQDSINKIKEYKDRLTSAPLVNEIVASSYDVVHLTDVFNTVIARMETKLSDSLNDMADSASNSEAAKEQNICN